LGQGPAGCVYVRRVDDKRRRLVQASALHSRPLLSKRERVAVKDKIREIDAEAVADVRRAARRAVQVPRPSRGGGSIERNRSRH